MPTLPIIIYDINRKQIERESIIAAQTLYFYSFQPINVEVVSNLLSDDSKLFSVLPTTPTPTIQEGLQFSNNFGYTLYIAEDLNIINLKISTNDSSEIFQITSNFTNTISEEQGNLHYNDLIVNNLLPNYDQLITAIPEEFETKQLIMRLLLEFKNILKYKGTRNSIIKFFDFIGYNDENLNVSILWRTPGIETLQTTPNQDSVKTADYSLLYNNYQYQGLDGDNMPNNETLISNLNSFSTSLINAISLANTYFTAPEQEIIFFGLSYATNLKNRDSITSDMNMIFENDVAGFRKDLLISVNDYEDNAINQYVINKKQVNKTFHKSERKYYLKNELPKNNEEIFFVDYEILSNDEIDAAEFEDGIVENQFLNIMQLIIDNRKPENKIWVEYVVEDLGNSFSKLEVEKQLIPDEAIFKQIAFTGTGNFRLTLLFHDEYNNYERYFYDFETKVNSSRIGMEVFNSGKIKETNNVDLEVESGSRISVPVDLFNYVLNENLIPQRLDEYYNYVDIVLFTQWLSTTDRYIVPSLNRNYPTEKITETLPLRYLEQWLQVLSFQYKEGYELRLKHSNDLTCKLDEIKNYVPELDNLYVTLIDVYENDETDTREYFEIERVVTLEESETLEIDLGVSLKPNSLIFRNGQFLFSSQYSISGNILTIDDILESDILVIVYNAVVNATPYYLITPLETGVEIVPELYDFVLVKLDDETITESIYNYESFTKNIVPVNYDFPLFPIGSANVEFETYISQNPNVRYKEINETTYPMIESVFPRLINISDDDSDGAECLKLGDIFIARLNPEYCINEKDVKWRLYDSFTGRLITAYDGLTLKYRISENTCYTIEVEMQINGEEYIIRKESILSSYFMEL